MVVYMTTNLINGKKYIGRDKNNKKSYLGSGKALKRAIKTHGKQNFTKEIIEYCKTEKELIEREEYWLKYYDVVNNRDFYNLINSSAGFTSDEISGEKNPMFGRTHREESKKIMSERHLGKKLTEEHKEKIGDYFRGRFVGEKNGFFGKTHPEESKKRMSEKRRGENNPMFGRKGEKAPNFKGYLVCIFGQYLGMTKTHTEWADFLGVKKQYITAHLSGRSYKNGIKGNFLRWEHDVVL